MTPAEARRIIPHLAPLEVPRAGETTVDRNRYYITDAKLGDLGFTCAQLYEHPWYDLMAQDQGGKNVHVVLLGEVMAYANSQDGWAKKHPPRGPGGETIERS